MLRRLYRTCIGWMLGYELSNENALLFSVEPFNHAPIKRYEESAIRDLRLNCRLNNGSRTITNQLKIQIQPNAPLILGHLFITRAVKNRESPSTPSYSVHTCQETTNIAVP